MRILFVSFVFPPLNAIGSLRVGKTARYLTESGHDVRVLTAKRADPINNNLPLEIASDKVIYTRWVDPIRFIETMKHTFNPVLIHTRETRHHSHIRTEEAPSRNPALWRRLWWFAYSFIFFPDVYIGWLPFALLAGSRLIKSWKPDVIYASSPPATSLVIAALLGRKYAIPYISDLRDLWVDYHDKGQLPLLCRRLLEVRLETYVLSAAAGLVTVSELWAETLKRKYAKPTIVVTNGFEPSDYPTQHTGASRSNCLCIVYTGTILSKQNPWPLFAALHMLGTDAGAVQITFYGLRRPEIIHTLAEQWNVEQFVDIHDRLPHSQALHIQTQADILLLLLWNDPAEKGVYPGKLFEYIGARRPILAVGHTDNAAGELIRSRQAGVTLDDPEAIAAQLRHWIQQKRTEGSIPSLPQSGTVGLSREEQTRVLEGFLYDVLEGANTE